MARFNVMILSMLFYLLISIVLLIKEQLMLSHVFQMMIVNHNRFVLIISVLAVSLISGMEQHVQSHVSIFA